MRRVLIADDDRIMVHLLSARLRSLGWQVEVARDAAEAVLVATREVPDVILLDVHMPGGSALEVLPQLKGAARTSRIPVVVLSGSIDAEEKRAVLALGAAEFLAKPAPPQVVHEVLERHAGLPAPGES